MDRTLYFLFTYHSSRHINDKDFKRFIYSYWCADFPASEFLTKDTIICLYCQSLAAKGHCISPKELILRPWAHVLFGCQVDLWRVRKLPNGHSVKGRGEGCEMHDSAGLAQAESLQVPTLERFLHRWLEHFWDFFPYQPLCFPVVALFPCPNHLHYIPYQSSSYTTISQVNIRSVFFPPISLLWSILPWTRSQWFIPNSSSSLLNNLLNDSPPFISFSLLLW